MPVICPRHDREVEIAYSHTGPQEIAPGVVEVRTTFTLECGEDVTLPSGRTIRDACQYTPAELADYAQHREERQAERAAKKASEPAPEPVEAETEEPAEAEKPKRAAKKASDG